MNCFVAGNSGFKRILLLVLVGLFIISADVSAQEKPRGREAQKKALQKKKEQQIEKQRKAEERLKKRHLAIQTAETRKRMKAANRKAKKFNNLKHR